MEKSRSATSVADPIRGGNVQSRQADAARARALVHGRAAPVDNVWTAPEARIDPDGTITITVNHPLRSLNVALRSHWAVRRREVQYWRSAILAALIPLGGTWLRRSLPPSSGIPGTKAAPPGRRRVTITCLLPSRAHTIRDVDNLWGSTKALFDALTAVGLIRDDAPAWCDRSLPIQARSADGRAWTVITLTHTEDLCMR